MTDNNSPDNVIVPTKKAYVPTVSRHDLDRALRDANAAGIDTDTLVDDLLDSVALAMSSEGVPADTAQTVVQTVNDYVANTWY